MTITDFWKRVSEIENCVSFIGCVEQRINPFFPPFTPLLQVSYASLDVLQYVNREEVYWTNLF